MRKKNVIYTPNGLSFIRKDISPLEVKLCVILEKVANWLNGKVVACSKSEADELIKKRIPSTYISNGTEVASADNQPLISQNDQITIVTSGRVTIQKNPSLFNKIASHFENDPHYQFIWIGQGELEHLLSSKNIKITGWLSRPSVLETVKHADIYLSTAGWEGLPFAVLEAMAIGKPLLLSNCVGNVDLAENAFNGFIYNNELEAIDKLTGALSDKDQLKLFGANSLKLVQGKFNVVDMAKNYETEYKLSQKA